MLSAVLFGLSTVLSRRALAEAGLFRTMYWNFLINSAVYGAALGVATWAAPPGFPPRLALGLFSLAGLAVLVSGRSLLYYSVTRIGAARASSFRVSSPLFTAALGIALLGEVPTWAQAAGMLATVGGLLAITAEPGKGNAPPAPPAHAGPLSAGSPGQEAPAAEVPAAETRATETPTAEGPPAETPPAETPPAEGPVAETPAVRAPASGTPARLDRAGITAGLAAAFSFSVGDIVRKAGLAAFPNPLVASAVSVWVAFAVVAVAALATGRFAAVNRVPRGAVGSLFLSSFGTALALLALNGAFRYAPVAVVTPLAATEALVAIGFARLLAAGQEHVSPRLVAGTAVVIAGVVLILRGAAPIP